MKSPSFSRSSLSTTITISPAAKDVNAFSIGVSALIFYAPSFARRTWPVHQLRC